VQLAALAGLTQGFGIDYRISTPIAVEIAVIHNFLWHERWTWPERAANSRLHRLWQFHLSAGVLSVLANVVLTILFVDLWRIPYLAANALAIGIASIANYLAADRLIWAERQS
jgi:putative flippase GtrA